MSHSCPTCGKRYNPDDTFAWSELDFGDQPSLFPGDVLELPCGHEMQITQTEPEPLTAAQIDLARRTKLFENVVFPWDVQ
jgi:hypothetical protein